DANDIACPDRLEKQMRFMSDHPEIALVGGQYEVMDTQGRHIRHGAVWKPVTEVGVQWYFLFDSPFVHSSVMFRKRLVDEVGRYDPAFDRAQDADLWRRMAGGLRMVNLPDVLVRQRYDATSITYDKRGSSPELTHRLTSFFAMNMKRYLATDDVERWAELMTAMLVENERIEAQTLQRYLEAVEAMEQRFIVIHPEGKDTIDIRRGKVQLLARALFLVALESRA